MTARASATIETKTYDELDTELTFGAHARGVELLSGDLDGTARWEGLMLVDDSGAGGYVSLLRFDGTVAGAAGSFVLRLAGTVASDGTAEADAHVVPGTATAALSGLRGHGTLSTGPSGSRLHLDYDLG